MGQKLFVIPAEVSDIDLPMQNGKPWSQKWSIFLREHILSWSEFDSSSDMMKVAESIRTKFTGKEEGAAVILSGEEWEQGKKALAASQIQPIFKPVTRAFRLAWFQAEDVKEVAKETPTAAPNGSGLEA